MGVADGLGEGVGVGVDVGVGLFCGLFNSNVCVEPDDECNDIPSRTNIIPVPRAAAKSLFIPFAFLLSGVPLGYTWLCVYNSQPKPHR